MSLSLLKYPPKVSLVEDPVLFKINTNNQFSNAGSYADIVLQVSALDTTVDHSFSLSNALFNITFTLKHQADDSGIQLPVATFGMSTSFWASLLFTYLKANYYLDKYYTFSMPLSNLIQLIAKEKGDDYTLSFNAGDVVGISQSSNNAGLDQQARDFFGVIVSTFLYENSLKTLIGEDLYCPDAAGNIYHDVSDLLKVWPASSFNWPDNLSDLIIKKTYAIRQFFIQYTEGYGIPPVNRALKSTFSILNYAIPGGLDRMKQGINNLGNADFYTELLQNRSFLTWQPKEKVISRTQPEKLFFLVLDNTITELRLVVNLYWTDGSSTHIIKKTWSGVSTYELFEIVVGFSKLNLEAVNPAKTVQYYEVCLAKQAGVQVSEMRTYILDTKIHSQERFFLFRNSLGWYDTLRITGEVENNNEYDPSLVEMITDPYFTNVNAPVKSADNTEIQTYNANTGWTDDIEKVNWFREFYLSREVYEVVSGILYPVVLTSKKIFIRKDNDYPYSGQFEYMRAWTDKHYSKDANMVYNGPVFTPSFSSSFQNSLII